MRDMEKEMKRTYEKVKAPADLKAETLTKVIQENEQFKRTGELEKTRTGKGKKRIFYYAALAAAACVALLCFRLFRPANAVYVTPIEDGNYYEEVELKDGTIYFVQGKVAIAVTPNAGQITIGEERIEEETQKALVTEETEDGGTLMLREAAQSSLPKIREEEWSCIGEQEIYVTVLKTDEIRYQAVYEKAGTVYEVVGSSVTQKEFIDFLYQQVK